METTNTYTNYDYNYDGQMQYVDPAGAPQPQALPDVEVGQTLDPVAGTDYIRNQQPLGDEGVSDQGSAAAVAADQKVESGVDPEGIKLEWVPMNTVLPKAKPKRKGKGGDEPVAAPGAEFDTQAEPEAPAGATAEVHGDPELAVEAEVEAQTEPEAVSALVGELPLEIEPVRALEPESYTPPPFLLTRDGVVLDRLPEIDRQSIYRVPIDLIDTELQDRQIFRLDKLWELAESMHQQGQGEPVLLRPHPRSPGRLLMVAGERRLRAARLKEWYFIDAEIQEMSDVEAARRQWLENSNRENLNVLEEALGIRRRMEAEGWTVAHAAESLPMRPNTLADRLALLEVPEDLHRMIAFGQVAPGYGVKLAQLHSKAGQNMAMFYFARRKRLNLDEFKRVVNHLIGTYDQPSFVEVDPDVPQPTESEVWEGWMASVVTLNPDAGKVAAAARSTATYSTDEFSAMPRLPELRPSASASIALERFYEMCIFSSDEEVRRAALVVGHLLNELKRLNLRRGN
ncbi:MAG: ParB/RepB/Spo0J family partition protein [Chloroflexota bacterium]|nr:ParB/RepB/Spo0J family partition protein [Chloroflexota bacterium]